MTTVKLFPEDIYNQKTISQATRRVGLIAKAVSTT